ncbi:MAG: DUF1702 family protein [Nodosilinea sp.]
MDLFSWCCRRCLSISSAETSFEKRRFLSSSFDAQQQLERVGLTFLQGYHLALEKGEDLKGLEHGLNLVKPEFRGFAFEGAAMGLALLDFMTPWKRNRIQTFLQGAGSAHVYMVHVGVGWMLARFPWQIKKTLQQLDPLMRWLAIDGYGFHEGYFHWPRYSNNQPIPRPISGYGHRAFDQGLGRSLWFIKGADVNAIATAIANFAPTRHPDLWSGVGLACAYAGGVDQSTLERLPGLAAAYQVQLAQGAAFAAKARCLAGNPAAHTDLACLVLCGLPAPAAVGVVDTALEGLPPDGIEPVYEVLRQRIQAHFSLQEAKV